MIQPQMAIMLRMENLVMELPFLWAWGGQRGAADNVEDGRNSEGKFSLLNIEVRPRAKQMLHE